MGRRTLLLIASILIAAVGTGLIGLYVRGADSRAQEGTSPVTILYALKDIPIDTPADQVRDARLGYLERRTVSARALPNEPIGTDLEGITGQTQVRVLAGAPLQKGMFGAAGASSDSLGVEDGRLAAAFELTDPARVAGMLQPGMFVSVYNTPKSSSEAKRVIEAVQVLRIGTQAPASADDEGLSRTSTNADQVARTILTLTLTNTQVQELLTYQRDGTLSFALRADVTKNMP